jgi:uncharacterized protein YrrD
MKISNLYGIKVERFNKKKNGYVLNIATEGNKITYLICIDDNEREFLIKPADIISIGEKIVFDKVSTKQPCKNKLQLGKSCFTQNGKFLGKLTDYECINFNLKFAIIGNKKFATTRLRFGDIIIVTDDKKNAPQQSTNLCPNCPHNMLLSTLL